MAGIIVGVYGYQRSGKSLIAYMISDSYRKKGYKVYTNVKTEYFNKINRLSEIPINNKPKVLWLDEAQYYLDSRLWKDNTKSSIFFNSIGKQNILLVITTIDPGMVEKRIREQQNYVIFAEDRKNHFGYRIIDCYRKNYKDILLLKSDKMFEKLRYNTLEVPDYIYMDGLRSMIK